MITCKMIFSAWRNRPPEGQDRADCYAFQGRETCASRPGNERRILWDSTPVQLVGAHCRAIGFVTHALVGVSGRSTVRNQHARAILRLPVSPAGSLGTRGPRFYRPTTEEAIVGSCRTWIIGATGVGAVVALLGVGTILSYGKAAAEKVRQTLMDATPIAFQLQQLDTMIAEM